MYLKAIKAVPAYVDKFTKVECTQFLYPSPLETILAGKTCHVALLTAAAVPSQSVEIKTCKVLPFAKLFEVSKDKNSSAVLSKSMPFVSSQVLVCASPEFLEPILAALLCE